MKTEKRSCLRLRSWFEVHEGRIMERFADVQSIHPVGKMLQERDSPFGRLPPAPGGDLLAGELRIPGVVPNNNVGRNRA
jgi:hypothetical protein